jgi:hypothetical protein
MAGLCTTLFNIGYIQVQKKQIQEAISAWTSAYVISKQLGLDQTSQALERLAPQLGLPEGLVGWELLAQHFNDSELVGNFWRNISVTQKLKLEAKNESLTR